MIEIMVTVAILSFGILAIYESFFISLDTYSYYTNYLNAQAWVSEKIWELEDQLISVYNPMVEDQNGSFTVMNKTFNWSVAVNPIDETNGVYRLDVSLFWKEGPRERFISRTVYTLREIQKEES